MADLKPKDRAGCRWDLVSLGEVMLRLDPGEGRIHTTRRFQVWEGGGEYNVARGLKRCFGLNTAVVTAFADNPVGHLVEDLIYQGGVDLAHPDTDFTLLSQSFPFQTSQRVASNRFGLYGQDQWHARKSLSLTFALLCMVDFALGVTPDYLPSKRDFHCVVC